MENKKGSVARQIMEVAGAILVLYVLWLVVRTIFF